MREIVNAIVYLLRMGVSVADASGRFCAEEHGLSLVCLLAGRRNAVLYQSSSADGGARALRTRGPRRGDRHQSVKTTESSGPRGYDAPLSECSTRSRRVRPLAQALGRRAGLRMVRTKLTPLQGLRAPSAYAASMPLHRQHQHTFTKMRNILKSPKAISDGL